MTRVLRGATILVGAVLIVGGTSMPSSGGDRSYRSFRITVPAEGNNHPTGGPRILNLTGGSRWEQESVLYREQNGVLRRAFSGGGTLGGSAQDRVFHLYANHKRPKHPDWQHSDFKVSSDRQCYTPAGYDNCLEFVADDQFHGDADFNDLYVCFCYRGRRPTVSPSDAFMPNYSHAPHELPLPAK